MDVEDPSYAVRWLVSHVREGRVRARTAAVDRLGSRAGGQPGEPSLLRHLARRPVDRAAVIRRGVAELGDRYGVEVRAWWNNNAGIWEVDFERG